MHTDSILQSTFTRPGARITRLQPERMNSCAFELHRALTSLFLWWPMEIKPQSMEILLQIERQILHRIEKLSQQQDRLQANKLLLRKHQALWKFLLSKNSQAETSAKEDKTTFVDESASSFSKLDGILNLAKEIRAGAAKSGKQNQSEEKTSRTESRQSLRDALSSTKVVDNKPCVDEVAQGPSKEELAVNDLHEQLLFLSRYRIALPVAKLYMNRSKYSNESKFLSKLFIHPAQPGSTLFRTIYPTLPSNDAPDLSTSPISPSIGADSIVVNLAQQFKSLIVHYDRHLRQRINHESYKLSQLSADEKRTMVALWLRGRKLMELYQHYVKTKQKLPCTCESCCFVRASQNAQRGTAIATLDHATPSYTPLPMPSTSIEREASVINGKSKAKTKSSGGSSLTGWVSTSKTRVEAFHDAYQSKVLLIAESAVGQEQLKGTIQALKSCCEDSTSRAKVGEKNVSRPTSNDSFVSKWVDSLKQFRLVYSILLNEAQELNHCIFINKT